MIDKSLSIALIIVFGLSGLALLLAAWTMPFMQEDRLMACIAGGIGVGFAAIRWMMLRHEVHHREHSVPVEIDAREQTGRV